MLFVIHCNSDSVQLNDCFIIKQFPEIIHLNQVVVLNENTN